MLPVNTACSKQQTMYQILATLHVLCDPEQSWKLHVVGTESSDQAIITTVATNTVADSYQK